MKTMLIISNLIAFFYFQSCIAPQKIQVSKEDLKFLFVSALDTSQNSFGQHIEIKQVLPDTDELILMTIEDRDIIKRSEYSRSDELTILKEYLSFEGDKRISNKLYRFKASGRMLKPDVANFTIEIEALYSFTKMLTITYSPIKPMLINRTTGEELNSNAKVIREVYDIYINWYNENEKTDFKHITLPLTGSPYCWLGEDTSMELFLKKSL
ncbi:MAG: hypothetical protein JSU05_10890 [Bacteroidetes bacterium]|nr:hypothetical protein [Bacteroidota bacterium]